MATTTTNDEVVACPFSVEMIADESDEGSTGSVHLAIPESSSMASKAATLEVEQGPELVRVESSEDSASTNSGDKESTASSEKKEEQSQATSQSSAIVVPNNHDDVGMIDCLSDQFANMFCPAGDQQICISRNETLVKEPACELPCTVFNTADPSTDVFSHLQFWWSPSQEEKLHTKRAPQNRSIRHKSKHIKSLMDNWHPTPAEPLMRSKSILEGHSARTNFPTNSTPQDGFYDSDPEEGFKKEQRRVSLQAQKASRNYKDNKPASLDTMLQSSSYDEDDHKPRPLAPKNATRRSFHFASRDPSPTSLPEFDLMNPANDDYIRQFVQVRIYNIVAWNCKSSPASSDTMSLCVYYRKLRIPN